MGFKESFACRFELWLLLNCLCDWSFEVLFVGGGVFDLKAHLGSEIRARLGFLNLGLELGGSWLRVC